MDGPPWRNTTMHAAEFCPYIVTMLLPEMFDVLIRNRLGLGRFKRGFNWCELASVPIAPRLTRYPFTSCHTNGYCKTTTGGFHFLYILVDLLVYDFYNLRAKYNAGILDESCKIHARWRYSLRRSKIKIDL